MTKIDDAIRQALSAEDAKVLERYGADLPLPAQLLETFRGRFGLLGALSWVMGLAAFAIAVYCGWRFASTSDVPGMLRWGGAAALAVTLLLAIKLWFWLELETNAVLREVKRLELQVARLNAR